MGDDAAPCRVTDGTDSGAEFGGVVGQEGNTGRLSACAYCHHRLSEAVKRSLEVPEADLRVAVRQELGGGWLVGAPEEGASCVRGAPDGAPWGACGEGIEVKVAVRSKHKAACLAYGLGSVVGGGPVGLNEETVRKITEGLDAASWGGSGAVLTLGRVRICVFWQTGWKRHAVFRTPMLPQTQQV